MLLLQQNPKTTYHTLASSFNILQAALQVIYQYFLRIIIGHPRIMPSSYNHMVNAIRNVWCFPE